MTYKYYSFENKILIYFIIDEFHIFFLYNYYLYYYKIKINIFRKTKNINNNRYKNQFFTINLKKIL